MTERSNRFYFGTINEDHVGGYRLKGIRIYGGPVNPKTRVVQFNPENVDVSTLTTKKLPPLTVKEMEDRWKDKQVCAVFIYADSTGPLIDSVGIFETKKSKERGRGYSIKIELEDIIF